MKRKGFSRTLIYRLTLVFIIFVFIAQPTFANDNKSINNFKANGFYIACQNGNLGYIKTNSDTKVTKFIDKVTFGFFTDTSTIIGDNKQNKNFILKRIILKNNETNLDIINLENRDTENVYYTVEARILKGELRSKDNKIKNINFENIFSNGSYSSFGNKSKFGDYFKNTKLLIRDTNDSTIFYDKLKSYNFSANEIKSGNYTLAYKFFIDKNVETNNDFTVIYKINAFDSNNNLKSTFYCISEKILNKDYGISLAYVIISIITFLTAVKLYNNRNYISNCGTNSKINKLFRFLFTFVKKKFVFVFFSTTIFIICILYINGYRINVASNDSMSPEIKANDCIVTKEIIDYRVDFKNGDNVIFETQNIDSQIMGKCKLKGNEIVKLETIKDKEKIDTDNDNIKAKIKFRIPKGGYIFNLFSNLFRK